MYLNVYYLQGKNGPQKNKIKKLDESEELISLARKHLQQPQRDFDKIISAWAVEHQKMTSQQQMFAKKAINDKAKWALCTGILYKLIL